MNDPKKCDYCDNEATTSVNGDYYCDDCYESQMGSLLDNDNDDFDDD
jgi:hypothetical protein